MTAPLPGGVRVVTFITLLAVAVAAPPDPPPLQVRVKTPAAGDRYRCAYESSTTNTTSVTVMGNAVPTPAPKPMKDRRTFVDQVLDWPANADGPVGVRRRYTRDEAEGAELPGAGALLDRKFKLTADGVNKPVEVAADDDGGDPPDAARGRLGTVVDVPFRGWAFYYLPANPVAVGNEYKLDLEAVAAALTAGQFRWDAGASSAAGKLVSRTRKDGAEYGRVEVSVDLVLTKQLKGIRLKKDEGAEPEDVETPLKDGSKSTLRLVFEGCLDGSRYDLLVTETLTTELRPELPAGAPVEVRTVLEREATDKLDVP